MKKVKKVKKLKSQIIIQKMSGARSLSDTIDYTAFAVAEGPLGIMSLGCWKRFGRDVLGRAWGPGKMEGWADKLLAYKHKRKDRYYLEMAIMYGCCPNLVGLGGRI